MPISCSDLLTEMVKNANAECVCKFMIIRVKSQLLVCMKPAHECCAASDSHPASDVKQRSIARNPVARGSLYACKAVTKSFHSAAERNWNAVSTVKQAVTIAVRDKLELVCWCGKLFGQSTSDLNSVQTRRSIFTLKQLQSCIVVHTVICQCDR